MSEPLGPAIRVIDASKSYEDGRIPALVGASLEVQRGEFVAIMGPSGCGKSTLLHLIAALERPDSGDIFVLGHDLAHGRDLDHVRSRDIGLIFQLHHLLPTLSALENVQVPMFETGLSGPERRQRAADLLALVDLADRGDQRPSKLSGGERQRVAIARALANDPPILLADEPSGSLDSTGGARILDLLERLRQERGLTIVMVTHDPTVAARADRTVHMLDGRTVDTRHPPATPVDGAPCFTLPDQNPGEKSTTTSSAHEVSTRPAGSARNSTTIVTAQSGLLEMGSCDTPESTTWTEFDRNVDTVSP
jgi:putative ABC transport system ATP-binding protein